MILSYVTDNGFLSNAQTLQDTGEDTTEDHCNPEVLSSEDEEEPDTSNGAATGAPSGVRERGAAAADGPVSIPFYSFPQIQEEEVSLGGTASLSTSPPVEDKLATRTFRALPPSL